MALYGAFFAGISGMNSTSKAIAVASDNITNTNSVGYKSSSANFITQVTQTSSKNSYSSGGVEIANRRAVDIQGMIQATGVVTDIAVSGKGLFVVNSKNDVSGDFLFTRAGSFRQDALGNFVNSGGMTLLGWPLDNEGRIPGAPGNLNTISSALLDSLKPVNLKTLSNAVAATTRVNFSINLDSGEDLLEGAGQTISIVNTSAENATIGMDDIIVPNANIREGTTIRINNGATSYTYQYGGVSFSNDVSLGILGSINPTQVFTTGVINGDQFTISNPTIGTYTFTFTTNAPDTTSGFFNNLATLAEAMNRTTGLTARVQNNRLFVSAEDSSQALTFANVGAATMVGGLGFFNVAAAASNITNDGVSTSDDITAVPMFGQNTTTGAFVGPTNGDTLTIATPSLGTISFTFNSPPGAGQFDTLANLATLINAHAGFNANISNNRLSISPADPTDTMTFGFTGTNFPATLNLPDTTTLPGTVRRFSTLAALQTLVNNSAGIKAKTETSGVTSARLKIYNTDPLGTITYDYGYPLPGSNNILTEFSLQRNVATTAMTTAYDNAKGVPTTTPTGPAYDPTALLAGNMAGGLIVPHFSRNFEVYDPLGARHDFRASFLKIGINVWAMEVYALNPNDIVSTSGRTDGLVSYGNVTFNGDGSLRDVDNALVSPITFTWTNGALPSTVTLFMGTAGVPAGTVGATQIGLRDGLSQIRSDYNVQFVEQNGVSAALLSSVSIDDDGFVIANYRNGLSQKLFQIPLADFPNPNGLTALDGNVFASNQEAGAFNLREPNTGGVGGIKSSALEQANVELSDELTRLVVYQRGYEADTQIIKTVNDLLRELNRLFT
ncbi:MAG: flagellar hook-basal body complex protein [Alphaproteobacteria bacterium]|nr:flagellar hook-basal body complex protein [Alphaproteobacteria bacterium]